MNIVCREYVALASGTGVATLEFPEIGLIVRDCVFDASRPPLGIVEPPKAVLSDGVTVMVRETVEFPDNLRKLEFVSAAVEAIRIYLEDVVKQVNSAPDQTRESAAPQVKQPAKTIPARKKKASREVN